MGIILDLGNDDAAENLAGGLLPRAFCHSPGFVLLTPIDSALWHSKPSRIGGALGLTQRVRLRCGLWSYEIPNSYHHGLEVKISPYNFIIDLCGR